MYDNIHNTYDTAKFLITNENVEKVEKYLLSEIENGHASAEIYAYLSKVYLRTDRDELSLEMALKSVKLKKNYSYGIARAAYACVFIEDLKNARKYALKAYKNCGDNYVIIWLLVYVFHFLEMKKERDKLLEVLENISLDSADYYFIKASIYSSIDEFDMGIENMLLAEKKDYADKYTIYRVLTELYFEKKEFKIALKYAQNAMKTYDGDYRIYWLLARLYAELKSESKVIKYLKKCIDLGYKNEIVYGGIARAAYNLKRYKKALEYINYALLLNNDADNNFLKCLILSDMKKHEAALTACKKAIECDSSESDFYARCSYLYIHLKDNNKALKYANIAISLNPDDVYAYYLKGFVLSRFGQYSPAIDSFKRVIQMDPTDSENFEDICECYALVENYKKLLEYANTGLMLNKNNVILLYYKGQALAMLGEHRKAVTSFKKIIELDKSNPAYYVAAAYSYSQMEMWHECLEYSNQAIFMDKNNAEAFYLKGCALQNLNKPKEAQKMFEKADILTSV